MRIARCLAMGTLVLGAFGAALAQFAGPAPLSWRWAHSTPVSPLGSPLVVDDTVFVAVGNRVFALDRATGNQKWRYPNVEGVPGYFRSAPVIVDGVIAAAADNRYLYGIDAATGAAKWQWISQVPIVGQPQVVGSSIIVELNDNSIMGIRADNGQPAWTSPPPTSEPLPYKVYDGINGGLATHGSSILFMTDAGELIAISANTRKQLWKARFSAVSPDSVPVVFGDTVYVNSGTWLVAVNAISGSPRWQQNIGEMLAFSPAASAEGVMTVTNEGKALIFDAQTGRPKLKQPIDLGSLPAVRPTGIDKHFLAPLTSGALTLISPTDGSIVWSYIVRPLYKAAGGGSTTGGGGDLGGGPAGGGGLGLPGGGRGGGAPGGGGSQTTTTTPIAVPASGPGVLAGQTLLILMSDGSLLAFDKSTGVDKTGPTIQMTWPNPGEQVNGGELELNFKIDDEATGVNSSTVAVTIGGQAMELDYGRDGFAVVKINAFVKNKPLPDGHKVIKVTASDWLGNTTTAEFGLTVDNSLRPLQRTTSTSASQPGGGRGGGGRGGGGGGGGIGR